MRGMKIFIVDDNKQFRDAMKVYLNQALKHQIVGEAENGLEFLQRYVYKNDIVLMDLNMPEIDGYEALKKAFIRDTRIAFNKQLLSSKSPDFKKKLKSFFNLELNAE